MSDGPTCTSPATHTARRGSPGRGATGEGVVDEEDAQPSEIAGYAVAPITFRAEVSLG